MRIYFNFQEILVTNVEVTEQVKDTFLETNKSYIRDGIERNDVQKLPISRTQIICVQMWKHISSIISNFQSIRYFVKQKYKPKILLVPHAERRENLMFCLCKSTHFADAGISKLREKSINWNISICILAWTIHFHSHSWMPSYPGCIQTSPNRSKNNMNHFIGLIPFKF